MKDKEDPSCNNCKFWGSNDNLVFGNCLRYPPVITNLKHFTNRILGDKQRHDMCAFPVTEFTDVCGEWRRSKKEE